MVCLDAGHGGKDPGAVGKHKMSSDGLLNVRNEMQTFKEKDFNLKIVLEVGKILKSKGINVVYTRDTDVFIELSRRGEIANAAKADVFVSFHVNAAENAQARGVETFCWPGNLEGGKLAKAIQDVLWASGVFSHNRGVKTNRFMVINPNKTFMPSALVELGFITNKDDVALLQSKWKFIANYVVEGILLYLGVPDTYDDKYDEGKKIHKELELYLKSLPPSGYADKSVEKGVTSGIFADGDGDGLIDDPRGFLTREQLAVILDRLGLLD